MVPGAFPVGRVALVILCAIMAVSTGVATSTLLETNAATGHTAFVAQVVVPEPGVIGSETPLTYALATQRVEYAFGLISKERPYPETANRMVFAWADGAPDPRQDPTLAPTGDYAHVTDRSGARWLVWELQYQGGAQGDAAQGGAAADGPADGGYHAYAVELGPVRTLEDGTRYNHVLTYRAERLVAPLEAAAEQTAPPEELLEPGADPDGLRWNAQGRIQDDERVRYRVLTAVGATPQALQ